MPTKKMTSSRTPATKPAAKTAAAVAEHKHSDLQSQIAELKKEISALGSQCHSCCKDLAELKKAQQEESGETQDFKKLMRDMLMPHNTYASLRMFLKRLK